MSETQKESTDVPWIYQGMPVTDTDIPDYAIGYVYLITQTLPGHSGKVRVYVGKKMLQSTRRKRIGVREKAATKTRKTYKVEKKDSMWREYWGSSRSLHEARDTGIGIWNRYILQWCYSKKNMSYEETRYQFLYRVMTEPSFNDHIGNWYAMDIDKEKWDIHQQQLKEKRESKKQQ